MSRADGELGAITMVVPSGLGPSVPVETGGFNIMLVAEGFTANEQVAFRERCVQFAQWLPNQPFFDVLGSAFRIISVGVESVDSGIDDLRTSPPTMRRTFFDAKIRERGGLLDWDSGLLREICFQVLEGWHVAVLLCNTIQGRGIAKPWDKTSAVRAGGAGVGFANTVLHEIGHALFGLADEYPYYYGCGEETDRDERPWGSSEPTEPNITHERRRSHLKWSHFVPDDIEIPTQTTDDCRDCPSGGNPLSIIPSIRNDAIGLFEGAGYYHCGVYRPAFDCKMRRSGHPYFCRVCLDTIYHELRGRLPAGPAISAEPKELDVLQACVNRNDSVTRNFSIANFGNDSISLQLRVTNSAIDITPSTEFTLGPGDIQDCGAKLSAQTSAFSANAFIEIVDTGGNAAAPAIPVQFEVCDPRPQPLVQPNPVDFGRIPRSHTIRRRVLVINARACCSDALTVNIVSPSPPFVLVDGPRIVTLNPAPRESESDVDKEEVWVELTADPSLPIGPAQGQLQIILVGVGTSETIELRGEIVDPAPIDSVLALDRTDLMRFGRMELTHGNVHLIELAWEAADIYAGLLRPSDQIGLVRFDLIANRANGDVLVDLEAAGALNSGAGRESVRAVLNNDNFGPQSLPGGPELGRGALLAAEVLRSGSSQRRSIVLLTSGMSALVPQLRLAAAALMVQQETPPPRIYVVAFQADATIGLELAEFRQGVQDGSGTTIIDPGEVYVTGPLDDDHEFLLQKFYSQIIADETGQAFVYDPVEQLGPGELGVTQIQFGEIDLGADFVIACHPRGIFPKNLHFILETPEGRKVTVLEAEQGNAGDVQAFSGDQFGWRAFRCNFPLKEDEKHVGPWRIHVENFHPSATLRYSLISTARSDLRLDGYVHQASVAPNTPLDIVLKPTLFDAPCRLDEPVIVRVKQPDGNTRLLQLDRVEDGTFRGRFRDTALTGAYIVLAEVTATSPSGITLTRSRYMSGFIQEQQKSRSGRLAVFVNRTTA